LIENFVEISSKECAISLLDNHTICRGYRQIGDDVATLSSGVFGTIGRKVRLVLLDLSGSEDSIYGCFADSQLYSDRGSGGAFGS
jgi:hypothetical protein